MSLRLNPRHRILTMICLVVTGVVSYLYHTGRFYGHLEQTSRDWLMTNSTARRAVPDPQIVFLALDEATRSGDTLFSDDLQKSSTLRLIKKGFPWSRQVWADVVDRLAGAGAKAIALDLVFPGARESDPEGDAAFGAALDRHSDHVVIGTNLAKNDQDESGNATVSNTPKHILPTEALRPPAGRPSWLGFVNVYPDEDGLVRRVFFRTTTLEYFGFPPDPSAEELLSLAARTLQKAGFSDHIPATRQRMMLRYSDDFRPRSLVDIFIEDQWNGPFYKKGEFFRDKIVLIGASEQSSEDRLQTPLGAIGGPQVHLSAVNDVLHDDFVTETTGVTNALLLGGGGLLAWALGMWIRRPWLRLLLLAVLVVCFYEIVQNLYNLHGILSLILSPLLTLTGSGLTWSAWEQILDRRERHRTRLKFERYVSKDAVREILDNPTSYLNSLGGERKEITVLFSDVRGFTTLTENTDPHRLVTQLNEYFEAMVAIVFEHHGTLDKFIGDAVMAHWGSIVSAGPEIDAERAVSTVLDMRTALIALNAGWIPRGMPEVKVGFGVNQGEAIVGNLGCEAKMEVSVIGDAVNLGSRLEGATKAFKLDLCIGENVAALVRDKFILRSVDLLIVKGKTKPVEIFTVLGRQSDPAPPWLERHEEAVRLYRTGNFLEAEKTWQEVVTVAPGDGLSEVFLQRCFDLLAEPPTDPWTGVYEMKSK